MQDQFSLTTRRAAALAGVEQHVLATALQRHGHWRGIVPRRLPNRRLLWPAVALYEALGKLPPTPRRSPAARLREHLCERAPAADPYHVQLACDALHSAAPFGESPRRRLDNLKGDLDSFVAQGSSLSERVRNALNDEEHATDGDWRDFNDLAARIEREAELIATPLRWRIVVKSEGVSR